jgi:hypothetical protein
VATTYDFGVQYDYYTREVWDEGGEPLYARVEY